MIKKHIVQIYLFILLYIVIYYLQLLSLLVGIHLDFIIGGMQDNMNRSILLFHNSNMGQHYP